MNLKQIYDIFDSEEEQNELDMLLLSWLLQRALDNIKYQEEYGNVFPKLTIKEKV